MATKAFKQVWKSITGVPAVDLSAARYKLVNYDTDGNIVLATAAGPAIGVLEEPNKAGQPAQVVAHGFMFVTLGGTVTAGQEMEVGASGAAVVLASGKSIGICAVGGSSGQIGTILLK